MMRLETVPSRSYGRRAQSAVMAVGRQAARVLTSLDRGRRALVRDRLDHVGIERPLREPRDPAELLRFVLEDGDEFSADSLALDLRVGHALQGREKSLGCVHM